MTSEYDLINKYFYRSVPHHESTECGIGDDAAIISIPSHQQLVISLDTFIENIHFPPGTPVEDIGFKSLAVNLSDMAAMGAVPMWATLSVTLPVADETWLHKFSKGFFDLANQYSVELIGGDLCHGPLSITVQIQGVIEKGKTLFRKGAVEGDLVYVTGNLGDAGLGLTLLQSRHKENNHTRYLLNRLYRPIPRVEAGQALVGIANSLIDISDGIATDLKYILQASQVGAIVNLDKLPISEAFDKLAGKDRFKYALTSGDDYELCFTVSRDKQSELENRFKSICPITCIGRVTGDKKLQFIDSQGEDYKLDKTGYQHFL